MAFFDGTFFGGTLFGEGTNFFGGEFFGGDFFGQEVQPPVVETTVVGGGGRHRRRIPRYIRVDDEEDVPVAPPRVPFEPRPIAVMLPRLTSFEAGIEPHYIEMVDAANLRVKNAPPAWDEDEEWLLMQ
ncbi:MAG TPA: hypothetical protein VF885_12115 [Arthrobacter sp.]